MAVFSVSVESAFLVFDGFECTAYQLLKPHCFPKVKYTVSSPEHIDQLVTYTHNMVARLMHLDSRLEKSSAELSLVLIDLQYNSA